MHRHASHLSPHVSAPLALCHRQHHGHTAPGHHAVFEPPHLAMSMAVLSLIIRFTRMRHLCHLASRRRGREPRARPCNVHLSSLLTLCSGYGLMRMLVCWFLVSLGRPTGAGRVPPGPSRSYACGHCHSCSSQREGQLGRQRLPRAQQPGTQGQCRGLSGCHG
jgi:hypothetical protein